ncbi:PREDICTED: uncharacterized protein LOC109183758 [Ipomoea nil]|uniref:uncharacterized protein LOC109183758 n=1 Tax=Ipomoea nil TaxID=35883 RepID=UPI000901E458|nr:PREDICTED: uncharacterized protein LOC109183758 [Ipomoea nil]
MVALASRKMDVDTDCHLCKQQPETLCHLFVECTQVQPLWDYVPHLQLVTDEGFVSWFSRLLEVPDVNILKKCAAVCWTIWKHCNALVWNSADWQLPTIKHEIANLIIEWEEGPSHANTTLPTSFVQDHHLTVPSGTVCFYVDAAIFSDSGSGFFGVFMTNSNGDYVAAKNGSSRCLRDVFFG